MARHTDGNIYAFHNRCAHRGAEVCPEAAGNTNAFVCPYHAWSFHTDGSLASMPIPKGYEDFQDRKAEFGLERVPRLSSYKGFLFASLNPDGVDLETFLGAEVRSATGITVFSGMIGVTLFGLFLTPVFYVALRKLANRPLVSHAPADAHAVRA